MPKGSPRQSKAPVRVTARSAACFALLQQAKAWPDLQPLEPETAGLEPRDAALAHAIYEQGVRRWITLAFLFELALDRPWANIDKPAQAALIAGGAQVLFLSRVPAYAAIDETVGWIKSGPPRAAKAAGLVNAGLRGLTRMLGMDKGEMVKRPSWNDARDAVPLSDGSAVAFVAPVLPAEEALRRSVACGVPLTLYHDWIAKFSPGEAAGIASHMLMDAPVTLNTEFASESDIAQASDVLVPHSQPGCHVYVGEGSQIGAFLKERRSMWVQDASSTRAIRGAARVLSEKSREWHRASEGGGKHQPLSAVDGTVSDSPELMIIDLCAGQGTKTRQLLQTFPNARVVASDTDEKRMSALRDLAHSESGTRRLEVVSHENVGALVGKADLVLLDVPCSNTGVLARRPEAAARALTDQLTRLVELQREIIGKGVQLLSPTGKLLYSTCSIDARENEKQAEWMSREFGLKVEHMESVVPSGVPGDPKTAYTDGAFSVLLGRQ